MRFDGTGSMVYDHLHGWLLFPFHSIGYSSTKHCLLVTATLSGVETTTRYICVGVFFLEMAVVQWIDLVLSSSIINGFGPLFCLLGILFHVSMASLTRNEI